MIRLSSKVLSGKVETHLSKVQARVDVQADFAAKAIRAKNEWDSKTSSKTKRAAFGEIKETLLEMCVGTEICNYCENNEATDIEHIYPKSFFPERAFHWDNYLLACKTCNSTYKQDRFAIFDLAFPNKKIELSRGSG